LRKVHYVGHVRTRCGRGSGKGEKSSKRKSVKGGLPCRLNRGKRK